MRLICICHLILFVLLISLFISSDGARKKNKKKSRKNSKVTEEDSSDISSQREKHSKITGSKLDSTVDTHTINGGRDTTDLSLQTDDLSLQEEENELRVNLLRAIVNHGDDSLEKATALHVLGRTLYHQRKYSDVTDVSNEIVRIHEKIDGPESIQVALGLITSVLLNFNLSPRTKISFAITTADEIIIAKFNNMTEFCIINLPAPLLWKITLILLL